MVMPLLIEGATTCPCTALTLVKRRPPRRRRINDRARQSASYRSSDVAPRTHQPIPASSTDSSSALSASLDQEPATQFSCAAGSAIARHRMLKDRPTPYSRTVSNQSQESLDRKGRTVSSKKEREGRASKLEHKAARPRAQTCTDSSNLQLSGEPTDSFCMNLVLIRCDRRCHNCTASVHRLIAHVEHCIPRLRLYACAARGFYTRNQLQSVAAQHKFFAAAGDGPAAHSRHNSLARHRNNTTTRMRHFLVFPLCRKSVKSRFYVRYTTRPT